MSSSRPGLQTRKGSASSFRKFCVPPRIHDYLLEKLSLPDYTKYVYFHAKLKRMLHLMRKSGAAESAILDFGESADWLRAVEHFFRRWSPTWAYAYIHHSFPAFYWPGNSEWKTPSPLTFAFSYLFGDSSPLELSTNSWSLLNDAMRCYFCGRTIVQSEVCLRWGAPGCSCGKPMLYPIRVYVIVSDVPIATTFLERASKFSSLDAKLCEGFIPTDAQLVLGFPRERRGPVESLLKDSVQRGIPTFIWGHTDVSRGKRSQVDDSKSAISGVAGGMVGLGVPAVYRPWGRKLPS